MKRLTLILWLLAAPVAAQSFSIFDFHIDTESELESIVGTTFVSDSELTALGLVDGSGTANQCAFWSDSDTITSESSCVVESGAGADTLVVDSNSRVGIGTASPTFDLEVDGTISSCGTASNWQCVQMEWAGANIPSGLYAGLDFTLVPGTNRAPALRVYPSGSGSGGRLSIYDDSSLTTEEVRLDSTGDSWIMGGEVGIGTASPFGTAHVRSAASGASFANSNADELVVEGSGNTGISLISPDTNQVRVHFGDASAPAAGQMRYDHSIDRFEIWSNAAQGILVTSGQEIIFPNEAAVNSDPIALDSSGNIIAGAGSYPPNGSAGGDLTGTYPNPTVAANAVALGTDTTGGYAASSTEGGSPSDYSAAVDLDASGNVVANGVALGTDTTGNYAAGDAEAGNATGLACSSCVGASDIATGAVGSSQIAAGAVGQSEIATNGVGDAEMIDAPTFGTSVSAPDIFLTVGAGTNSAHVCRNGTSGKLTGCSSLRAAKAGERPVVGALALAVKLQPRRFTWRDTGREGVGLIAEDVEQVDPALAEYFNDRDLSGVSYDGVAALAIAAVQELSAQVEKLEVRIRELEGR